MQRCSDAAAMQRCTMHAVLETFLETKMARSWYTRSDTTWCAQEYAVDVSQSGSLLTRSWKRYTEFESLHAKARRANSGDKKHECTRELCSAEQDH